MGLAGIRQAERVRIRPYVVSGVERLRAVADPKGTDQVLDVGIDDLKLALTSNLTADLTVNPDFAQTEVDLPPKVVPPRVLVQAPPFGWGVVQEAEVG